MEEKIIKETGSSTNETIKDLKKHKKMKPWTIVMIVILALILGFAGFVVYKRYFAKDKASLFNPLKLKVSEDLTVANKLDGTKVLPDKATRHPLAIMVENHPEARPQVGLDKASIIYEAITEGGITRFMAVYGPYDAEKVGPVRSARTYFIDWLKEFDAFYAHVGGNLDALDKIKADGIMDLDQFGLGEAAYWRVPKAGAAIEHTMYTSTAKLYDYAFNKKKWTKTDDFTSLTFAAPKAATERNTGQAITIDFSSPQYLVRWTYDKASNTYLRELAGKPHKDQASDKQLSSTNVIIQEVERSEAVTAINEQGWKMQTTGIGKAYIFSEGKRIDGSWNKTDQNSRTIFKDGAGKEITFTPGQFWVEIVPPDVFANKIKITDIPANLPTK